MTDFNAIIDVLVFCDTGKVTNLVNDACSLNQEKLELLKKIIKKTRI